MALLILLTILNRINKNFHLILKLDQAFIAFISVKVL